MGLLSKIFGTAQERMIHRYRSMVTEVNHWDEQYQSLSDEALRQKTPEFRERIAKGESLDDLLPEAYGCVKAICRRLWGTEIHVSGYDQLWDMIPYDVQILGGIAMHYGSIAEMQTGEGKTLTATMPLYLNALSGKPVHLVTVNDYLAQRDCEWAGTVLRWAGLTTGVLTNQTPGHERYDVYRHDVVYGTASEFGFDYLRDNSMVFRGEDQVQRGYFFAIVDEIDSILIDEARTPLIISGPSAVSRQMYDDLKGGVHSLVRQQREQCNQIAGGIRKVLEKAGLLRENEEGKELSKQEGAQVKQALIDLWIVSKGTPKNKVLKRIRENPELRDQLDRLDTFYHGEQNKEERHELLSNLLVIVDERASEFELTDQGISAWADTNQKSSSDDFVMLDLGDHYHRIDLDTSLSEEEKLQKKIAVREEDSLRKERAHNLRQLLRAHLLMECDVDYIVQDQKIVIIDENTGRPQPGRRFADGLHQAIEAKEDVPVQRETQTYATITLQNYFRLYDKLSGMTGTAATEAGEFREIYHLDVLQIPTYKKCLREDQHDLVFMTQREKYHAILEEVRRIHEEGRPILLGTESVDVSEKLSRIFSLNKLPHTVLNARHHDREAEIISKAGQKKAITIATNMAGRGTDIKLGESIAELGGLHVIGVTRHHSRRIDRQLSGRSARLGDPGSSLFFVSFEDQLMRLFASPRINAFLKRLRPPEGESISGKMLTRTIESAQKRVEQSNYMTRKQTLEYDDVMNRQRQEIYALRNDVLHTSAPLSIAEEILEHLCFAMSGKYLVNRTNQGWDPEGYGQWLMGHFPISLDSIDLYDEYADSETIARQAASLVLDAFRKKISVEAEKVHHDQPTEIVAQAARNLMIRTLDSLWQDHLLSMDHLRSDVSLRAVAQKDPLLEFKHEAFALFDELGLTMQEAISSRLFLFEIVQPPPPKRQVQLERRSFVPPPFNNPENPTQSYSQSDRSHSPGTSPTKPIPDLSSGLHPGLPPSLAKKSHLTGEVSPSIQQKNQESSPAPSSIKISRNDPCPCGSGKKHKRCCGLIEPSSKEA